MQCELINTANFVGNFAGSEAREGEAMITFSAQRDCFKHAFAEINADNRIAASGHGLVTHVAETVPSHWRVSKSSGYNGCNERKSGRYRRSGRRFGVFYPSENRAETVR